MKKLIYTYIFVPIFVGFFMVGCQETNNLCPADKIPFLHCLLDNNSGIAADTFVVVLDEIDSIIYNDDTPPEFIKIPINLASDSTQIKIFFHKSSPYYLKVYHKPNIVFNSPDCAFITSFELDTVIDGLVTNIESFDILNTLIDDEQYDNIKIFY